MKIALLTPGTGHFYCGSCLRDSALARGLLGRGQDAYLVPLYLPFHLEEPAPPPAPVVRMGGINLYLQHRSALFRWLPRSWTRFLDRPGVLRWGARRGNMTDARRLGPITLSTLRGGDGPIAREVDHLVGSLAGDRPDVVLLSNAMLTGVAARLREALECPVACTMQGEAPFLDDLPQPHRDEAWAILRENARQVDGWIPVSRFTAELMGTRLGVPAGRMHVAHNGIAVEDLSPAARPPEVPTIGYLARMCADKGLPTLVEAFEKVCEQEPPVRLRVAGVRLREDEALVRSLEARLARRGLAGQVEFLPNLPRTEKIAFLQSLSVLSVPATYGESFGLYVLEALACGVPVVEPRHGAFPEVIEATGGGILCEPDDAGDLARGLLELLRDPEGSQERGRRGRRRVLEEFTEAHMAQRVESILTGMVA